nr:MAG TPA_asm: hypothetical protein [Caudoviricetes sp.]
MNYKKMTIILNNKEQSRKKMLLTGLFTTL